MTSTTKSVFGIFLISSVATYVYGNFNTDFHNWLNPMTILVSVLMGCVLAFGLLLFRQKKTLSFGEYQFDNKKDSREFITL